MSLAVRISALATRIAQEINAVRTEPAVPKGSAVTTGYVQGTYPNAVQPLALYTPDTRLSASSPDDYTRQFEVRFKNNSDVGISGGGFCTLVGIHGFSTGGGEPPSELAFTGTKIYTRQAVSNAAGAAWGAWTLLGGGGQDNVQDNDPRLGITELAGAVDFNTLQTQGLYIQSQNADAATATNSPSTSAGLLQVFGPGPAAGMVYQRYTVYRSGGVNQGAVYERSFYSTVWSPWVATNYDSGWVALTMASGWTSAPSATQRAAACRRVGNRIFFRGIVTGTLTVATTTQVATVPVNYRPENPSNFNAVASTGGFTGWSNVTDLGALSVHFKTPYATGSVTIELTGISYMLD